MYLRWCISISVLIFSAGIIINRRGRHFTALLLIFLEVNIHATLAVHYLGWASGFSYYILAVAPVIFFFPMRGFAIKVVAVIASADLYISLYFKSVGAAVAYPMDPMTLNLMYISNTCSAFFVLSYIAFFYSKSSGDAEQALRVSQSELEKAALTDALTRLPNRRAIDRELDTEISRHNRNGKAFCLMICDIDDFKAVNDRFGHECGDLVLQSIAHVFTYSLRKHDCRARWGGEEFLVIFPETPIEGAKVAAEKLRREVEQNPILLDGEPLKVTMSFGLCAFERGLSKDACVRLADQALYEGKRLGKNRVVIADSGPANTDQASTTA